MRLKKLKLIHFRNYHRCETEFGSGINVITGANASGKTNLLEAVGILSMTRSFRRMADRGLCSFDNDSYYISAVVNGGQDHELSVAYSSGRKQITLDTKKVTTVTDYIGTFNTVVFQPDDISVIKGGPVYRRRFIDALLSSVSREYFITLKNYLRVLKQKNAALHLLAVGRGNRNMITALNNRLVELGAFLAAQRLTCITGLQPVLADIYSRLSNQTETIQAVYNSRYCPDTAMSAAAIAERISREIAAAASRECQQQRALIGPHLDDVRFRVNGRSARYYSSQGQQKSAAIALHLAAAEYIRQRRGDYPVLLLDDIFSELDRQRRDFLVTFLDRDIQSFITTVDDVPALSVIQNSTVFNIKGGSLVRQ